MYLSGSSAIARLVRLTCAQISPVYTWEAFLPPYPFLIPHLSFFFSWFPSISRSDNLIPSYNYSCSAPCRMLDPISSSLCLYPVRRTQPDRRLGVFLGYRSTLVSEQSTLPILDRDSNPSPCCVLSRICLSIDLNGELILEYLVSRFRILQSDQKVLPI